VAISGSKEELWENTFKVTSGAKACHFASSKKMGPTTRAMGGVMFAEEITVFQI